MHLGQHDTPSGDRRRRAHGDARSGPGSHPVAIRQNTHFQGRVFSVVSVMPTSLESHQRIFVLVTKCGVSQHPAEHGLAGGHFGLPTHRPQALAPRFLCSLVTWDAALAEIPGCKAEVVCRWDRPHSARVLQDMCARPHTPAAA